MRKVILNVAVTLDNFIEGPNGEYDWCFTDHEYGMTDFLSKVDTVFYGRKSYELMARQEGGLNAFGKKKNFVFSNTIKQRIADAEVISGDVISHVKSIKSQQGQDIWLFGGASLSSVFMKAGLIDALWLSIHPILLGKGKPLFEEINERVKLELVNTKSYPSGLVQVYYQVIHK